MPGKSTAVSNGEELKRAVAQLGKDLGLDAEMEYKVGRRIWGAKVFQLIGDYCDGPWQGVVEAWYNYSGQPLTLTAGDDANVYLIVAKYAEQVIDVLNRERLDQNVPVVWINDFAMTVREFAGPNEAVVVLTHS
jgi:hypothetical protein